MRGNLIGPIVTAMLLASGAAGAGASTTAPQITDPAGDANGLDAGDTRPVSYDPADLLSVRLETTYAAIPVGEDGVDHQATGLRIRFRTLVPARSDGPTMEFTLDADLDGCPTAFHGYISGPLTNAGDARAGTATWTRYTECPNTLPVRTATSVEHERFSTEADAATGDLVLTFPFDALASEHGMALKEGSRIGSPRAYVQTSHGAYLLGTLGLWIDLVTLDLTQTGSAFVVGEDVPEDRPCTRRCPERGPDRPECRTTASECRG